MITRNEELTRLCSHLSYTIKSSKNSVTDPGEVSHAMMLCTKLMSELQAIGEDQVKRYREIVPDT